MCSLVILSKYYSTKSKTLLAESFGQRLLVIFTALSPFYVEQPHDKGSALYKYPKIAAKTISKDKQTLSITCLVQNKTKCKLLGAVYLFLLKSKLNSVVFAYDSIFYN